MRDRDRTLNSALSLYQSQFLYRMKFPLLLTINCRAVMCITWHHFVLFSVECSAMHEPGHKEAYILSVYGLPCPGQPRSMRGNKVQDSRQAGRPAGRPRGMYSCTGWLQPLINKRRSAVNWMFTDWHVGRHWISSKRSSRWLDGPLFLSSASIIIGPLNGRYLFDC